jgi:hypothetical protein
MLTGFELFKSTGYDGWLILFLTSGILITAAVCAAKRVSRHGATTLLLVSILPMGFGALGALSGRLLELHLTETVRNPIGEDYAFARARIWSCLVLGLASSLVCSAAAFAVFARAPKPIRIEAMGRMMNKNGVWVLASSIGLAIALIVGAVVIRTVRDTRAKAEREQFLEANLPRIAATEKGERYETADTTTVEIYHVSISCRTLEEGRICTERAHWRIGARGIDYTPSSIGDLIKREAFPDRGPKDVAPSSSPRISEHRVRICADRGAPYEYLQKVIERSAIAGIYKVEFLAEDKVTSRPVNVKIWLPTDREVGRKVTPLRLPEKRSLIERKGLPGNEEPDVTDPAIYFPEAEDPDRGEAAGKQEEGEKNGHSFDFITSTKQTEDGAPAKAASERAGEDEDYQAAIRQGTIEGWESYLATHPAGTHAKAARESHDDLLGRAAEKSAGDVSELEALFKRCRTPAGSDRIFGLWDDALWNVSRKTASEGAWRAYLLRFPGGRHVKEANAAIEETAWHRCVQARTVESFQAYLKEYASGVHAKEAREVINTLEYDTVRAKDTVEGYEEFLKNHNDNTLAGKRLRQLRYERAVQAGTLEGWKEFYDKYRWSGWTDDGRDVEQMKHNAAREIERLLYEKIVAEPTLASCRDYLYRYRDGPDGLHKQQVIVKMEPYMFEEALRSDKRETLFEYLELYPEGFRDADVRKQLDALVFKALDEKEDFSAFERYFRLSPRTRDALLARMEPLMYEWAKRVDTVESCTRYLETYPDGSHAKDVRSALDPVLFKKAREEDWYSAYEEYIKKCPEGRSVRKARERIDYLKANQAVVQINFPKVLEQRDSPYQNVSSPFWSWDTVFRETGGKIGFKVRGSGYIEDPRGGRWDPSRKEVNVPASGSGKDDTWFSSGSHALCNGNAIFTWTGEDAGGHPIRLEERVKLQHTGCPGPDRK